MKLSNLQNAKTVIKNKNNFYIIHGEKEKKPNTKLCAWGEEDSGGHVL